MANSIAGALGGLRRWFSLFMGAAALVAVGMACGGFPVLQEAPASALSLGVRLSDEGTLPPGKISLAVSFDDAKQSVRLSGKQQLTCDGVDLIPPTASEPITIAFGVVNRQPPGGAYTCIYTDENGKRTAFSIPEPTGHLAITSPRAGAKVPMPWQSDKSLWYLETPAATPEPPILHNPFTIAYTLPDRPINQYPVGPVNIRAIVYGCVSATQTPFCDVETEAVVAEAKDAAPAQTGALLVSDVPVHEDTGYDRFFPGPGKVDLFLNMSWMIAPQGFRSIGVAVEEHITTTFTWVASK